jgi:V-type H+-transporting ATPase subunit H
MTISNKVRQRTAPLIKRARFLFQLVPFSHIFPSDISVLSKLCHNNYKEMSRWDLYVNEVMSGNLEWGILHTEKFFKQNCRELEGKNGDFMLLKRLIVLLTSDDDDIASVACFDIGEFVRHYPNGKMIAKQLGAKEAIMKLIEHDNADLQRHALTSMSKMLVQNWEAVR